MQRPKHRQNNQISYIKKPISKTSMVACGLAAAALLLCYAALRLSVDSQGGAGLNAGACGFCSLLVALFSIGYAALSFREREKNYILARVSLLAGLALSVFWISLIITAGKG